MLTTGQNPSKYGASDFFKSIRDAFREPHPFSRNTAYLKPYDVPWASVYLKRQLRTARIFFPLAVVMFGWPYLAKQVIERSKGVNVAEAKPVPEKPAKSHKVMRRVMLQEGPKAEQV